MSDTIDAKGQCLCGAVEIEAKSLQKYIEPVIVACAVIGVGVHF